MRLRHIATLLALPPLLALASAVLLAGCGPRAAPGSPDDLAGLTLRVGAPNRIGNRPYLEASGELARAPYRVQWVDFSATPTLLEALRNDDIDLGGNGGSTGIIFESANVGTGAIRIVAAGRAEGATAGGAAVIVRAGAPLHRLADLRGQRVSVMQGTGSQYIMERDLGRLGIGPQAVRWSQLANDVALAALVAGHIDALVIWEPQASALLKRSDLRLLTWAGSNADSYALQFASQKALDDPRRRAAIADFLQRLARAHVWATTHQAAFAAAASKQAGVDPDVTRIIAAKTRTRYGLTPAQQQAARQTLANEVAFWRQRGIIRADVPLDKVFDFRFEPLLVQATAGR
ncbi:MAG TPA: transporter substrate-binding domain-containing protein [Novosphingobium sp.]|nr:transporter substrate-binding domain-containing protein [Novosphingobium sp.]